MTTTNVYFSGLKDSKFLETVTPNEKFIIFQNDELHLRVQKLEKKITTLESKNSELELDVESAERSNTNLKGLNHNLVENNKKISQLANILNDNIVTITKKINISVSLFWFFAYQFICLLVFIVLFEFRYCETWFQFFWNLLDVILIVGLFTSWFVVYKIHDQVKDIQTSRNTKQINDLKKEIRETKQSIKDIHNFIDIL